MSLTQETTTVHSESKPDELDKIVVHMNGKTLTTEERIEQVLLWIRTNKSVAKL